MTAENANTTAPASKEAPIEASVTKDLTKLKFAGTDFEITDSTVVVHTSAGVRTNAADDAATQAKGSANISYGDKFNSVATRGVSIKIEEDNGARVLAVSTDSTVRVLPLAP